MTQPGAELAQPERPRRLLRLVPSAGMYAVTRGDTAPSMAAPARTSETTSAAPVVQTDPFALGLEAAAAASASVVDVAVTSGDRSGHRCARGAGVIFDTAGHILTRYCVVAGTRQGSTISVTLKDKRTFEARVVDLDPSTDLALLKLNDAPKDLRAIELDDLKVFTADDPAAS
jgi:putative serine protease PepD